MTRIAAPAQVSRSQTTNAAPAVSVTPPAVDAGADARPDRVEVRSGAPVASGGPPVWARVFQPSSSPTPFAKEALKSASEVTREYLLFQAPAGTAPTHGVVFIGGAKVKEEAYAPIAKALAERGVSVAIVRSPLDLPFLLNLTGDRIDAAVRALRRDAPQLPLAIGGHSAGGFVASSLRRREFDDLVLVNARTQGRTRAEVTGVAVNGALDGLISEQERAATAKARPGVQPILFTDLDHDFAQGLYGAQDGDPITDGSPEALVARVAAAIADGLRAVDAPAS